MPGILALAILIGILTCVFALQNPTVTPVQFLVWKMEASLALVLLATFALGAAVGIFACLPTLVKAKWKGRAPEEPKKDEPKKETPAVKTEAAALPPKEEPQNP